MAENIGFQIGNLTEPPRRHDTAAGPMATFTIGLNNDRRYSQQHGRYINGEAAFLNVVCHGELAKNVLAGGWATGQRTVVIGYLTNDNYPDPTTGRIIQAFQYKAIDATPSSRFNAVTVLKTPEPTCGSIRVGDMVADVTELPKNRQQPAEAPTQTPTAA